MQEPSPVNTAAELSRTLQALARTARARQLYPTNNRAYQTMRRELFDGFERLLHRAAVVSFRIRPDRIIYEEETVLTEPNPNDSIPFALYRDGLRRMDFSRGVTEEELEALLAAVAAGFAFSGLGDDIVSHLWKHDLEHIRYLVVDTSIVDAVPSEATGAPAASFYEDVEAQIDGLLEAIYGDSTDDVGPRAVRLDAADLGAKRIAEALDDVHEMAPGFHPARRLPKPPAYGADLRAEASREDKNRVAARAANAALRSLHQLEGFDADLAAEGLLRLFDAAVMADDLPLAMRLVSGVRSSPKGAERVQAWLDEAVSEARIRHAVSLAVEADGSRDNFVRLFQFLQACGPRVAPLLVPMLAQFSDPVRRRALTDLIADAKGVDLPQIRGMLDEPSIAVVQEALHLLRRSEHAEAATVLTAAERHPNPMARIALLEHLAGQAGSAPVNVATRLLNDPEPRVRIAASECLSNTQHADAASVIAAAVESPAFEHEDPEVKRAMLRAYARTTGPRALHVLAKLIKRGDGRLVRRESEELATHAILAAALVRDPRARELLMKTAQSKNRKVRETARQALERWRPSNGQ